MESIPKNYPENKSKTSAGQQILERARIVEVWPALGGGQLRYGRGSAFWRGGDDLNVSVEPAKNCWFDHVRGKGGGVLDLIETARDCDRGTALQWLANLYGIEVKNGKARSAEGTNTKPTGHHQPRDGRNGNGAGKPEHPSVGSPEAAAEEKRDDPPKPKSGYVAMAWYHYGDDLRKVRLEHKTEINPNKGRPWKIFRWQHRVGKEWRNSKGGLKAQRMYLNSVARECDQLERLILFESEASADASGELGIPAGSFRDGVTAESVRLLEGIDVIVWGDKDEAGKSYVKKAIETIRSHGNVRSLKVVAPPDKLPAAGDVIDGIQNLNWGCDEIEKILAEAQHIACGDPAGSKPKIITLAELRSMSIPEPEPIVGGFIRAGEVVALVGKPKIGKSRLTQQLTLCLSRGERFIGMPVYRTYRVLILDLENRPSGAKKRFENMSAANQEADQRVMIYAPETLAENSVNVVTPEGIEQLQELVEASRPDVVIVDTWRLLTSGKENKSDDVIPALRALSGIRNARKHIAIILVHHLRKQQGDNPPKLRVDPSAWIESCSGHHAFVGHVDAAYGMEREIDKDSHEELIVFGGVARSTSPRTIILNEDTEKTLLFEPADGEESLNKILTKKGMYFWQRAQSLRAFTATELLGADTNKKAMYSMLTKARQHGCVRQLEDRTYVVTEKE